MTGFQDLGLRSEGAGYLLLISVSLSKWVPWASCVWGGILALALALPLMDFRHVRLPPTSAIVGARLRGPWAVVARDVFDTCCMGRVGAQF